ncbi:MAG: hypothetical protein CK520_05160 [Actinobacteria bacterium]|nr:peptidylprolyl isomerase [Acidimicrobiia bacterium]PHX59306.1 MAG: hypothetical protein CK520_05160 [Actinomycetota bacterium]
MSKANKRERQRENREKRREFEGKIQRRQRLMKTARTFAIIAVPVLIVGVVLNLNNSSDDTSTGSDSKSCAEVKTPPAKKVSLDAPTDTLDVNQSYTATIDTSCGTIAVDLAAQSYPVSVNNFVYLANQKFYDDLAVVRAAKNFVIQTGSPTQTSSGGPGYSVAAEVPTVEPYYPAGTVAWAKSGAEPAGTAGSQFFIVTGNAPLPADYAVIGTVSKGLNVARNIEKLAPKSGDGALTRPVVMKKVTITTGAIPPATTP